MFGKSIKITEEEAMRGTIAMDHYKSGRVIFAIKSNRVDEPWFITSRTKPADFRPRWARTYVDLF